MSTTNPAKLASRMPAPFQPVQTTFEIRGKVYRVTVRRFWVVAVQESRNPDCLVWEAERGERVTRSNGGYIEWTPIDDYKIPKTVAAKAAEFFRSVAASQHAETPDLFT